MLFTWKKACLYAWIRICVRVSLLPNGHSWSCAYIDGKRSIASKRPFRSTYPLLRACVSTLRPSSHHTFQSRVCRCPTCPHACAATLNRWSYGRLAIILSLLSFTCAAAYAIGGNGRCARLGRSIELHAGLCVLHSSYVCVCVCVCVFVACIHMDVRHEHASWGTCVVCVSICVHKKSYIYIYIYIYIIWA